MRKIWHEEAWEDYLAWQGEDRKTLRRIHQPYTRQLKLAELREARINIRQDRV